MRTTVLSAALLLTSVLAFHRTAHAEKVTCDPVAKKLEWHVCVIAPVEYKRGMKTETRNECKVDKVIKPTNGCDFGDLAKHIPEGAAGTVKFYALAPEGFDESVFEEQSEPGYGQACSINSTHSIEGWELMKFGDAPDKSNRERSELVLEGLKKKKKIISPLGIGFMRDPNGCTGKSAKFGILDKKTTSKFLVYAEMNFAD
jgi:hypothetical protein